MTHAAGALGSENSDMPNIRRKNKKYQARLTAKGKSLSATFPTREAAMSWALTTRLELMLGKHADVERARRNTFRHSIATPKPSPP